MAILISIGMFAALLAAITYFGYRYYARPGRVYEQLGGQATFTMPSVDRLSEQEPGLIVSVMEQIGELMPIDPMDASDLRRDLISAGYKSERAVSVYLGIRIVFCAVVVLLALY